MSTNLTRRPDPLEDFFRGFFVRPVDFGGHPLANVSTDAPQMRVDVKEKADAYEVHAELPGMKKEDISLHYENSYLTIEAKKDDSKEEKDEKNNYIRRERSMGSVTRSFYIDNIDEAHVSAEFKDGVLKIDMPKAAVSDRPKEISIK